MLRLEIRLKEKEYAKIKAEAEKRGVSMADILREPIRFLPEV
ncbi:ribbon-helix-helix protein, CopG family [Argonema antarcticum]